MWGHHLGAIRTKLKNAKQVSVASYTAPHSPIRHCGRMPLAINDLTPCACSSIVRWSLGRIVGIPTRWESRRAETSPLKLASGNLCLRLFGQAPQMTPHGVQRPVTQGGRLAPIWIP